MDVMENKFFLMPENVELHYPKSKSIENSPTIVLIMGTVVNAEDLFSFKPYLPVIIYNCYSGTNNIVL